MTSHEKYVQRCIELAKFGAGNVAPNPMVGAILVHDDMIIGEGYHMKFGGPHAEVNCINSVKPEDKEKISASTLFVSLEPCAHFGKTPPCTDLIIANNIPEVIVGCRDPFQEVNGRGIEKLITAGIKVQANVLASACKGLNKRFFTFHTKHRPYIILKWAETKDERISAASNERLLITNEQTNRLVHKWRSEESSILVGTNTALVDDPELTTRHWNGRSPIRLVVDMDLSLPQGLKLYNQKNKTIVFNLIKHEENGNLDFYQVTEDVNLVHQIVNALYHMKIQSVIVEGGAKLLQSFIDEGMWDEARVIRNEKLVIKNGLAAPQLPALTPANKISINGDTISFFINQNDGI